MHNLDAHTESDPNLVAIWTRKDPKRWIAGVVAGLIAGAVSLLVAGLIASAAGYEFLFAPKLAATILMGSEATYIGPHMAAIVGGLVLYEAICAFLGFLFAHFVYSNDLVALLPMGLTWGVFSWIFIWNLFSQSFRTILAARISSGPVFLICIVFGVSLAVVGVVHRVMGGKAPVA